MGNSDTIFKFIDFNSNDMRPYVCEEEWKLWASQYGEYLINKVVIVVDTCEVDHLFHIGKVGEKSVPGVYPLGLRSDGGEDPYWRFHLLNNSKLGINSGSQIGLEDSAAEFVKYYDIRKKKSFVFHYYPKCKEYLQLTSTNWNSSLMTQLKNMDAKYGYDTCMLMYGPPPIVNVPKDSQYYDTLSVSFRVKVFWFYTLAARHFNKRC